MTFCKNAVIFGVDNSSLSQADNRKNNFSVLGQGLTYGIWFTRENVLVKQTQNFAWVCIIIVIIVICLLMENKSLGLKLIIKMVTFQISFV